MSSPSRWKLSWEDRRLPKPLEPPGEIGDWSPNADTFVGEGEPSWDVLLTTNAIHLHYKLSFQISNRQYFIRLVADWTIWVFLSFSDSDSSSTLVIFKLLQYSNSDYLQTLILLWKRQQENLVADYRMNKCFFY